MKKCDWGQKVENQAQIQDVLANGNKENEIIEAAKKLRGKIPTPKAKKEFDKNSTGMRMCRIGNRNVALFPHTLHTLLNDVEDDDFFQDAYEYARPMNTAECELNFQSEITQTLLLSMSSSMRAFSFALTPL